MTYQFNFRFWLFLLLWTCHWLPVSGLKVAFTSKYIEWLLLAGLPFLIGVIISVLLILVRSAFKESKQVCACQILLGALDTGIGLAYVVIWSGGRISPDVMEDLFVIGSALQCFSGLWRVVGGALKCQPVLYIWLASFISSIPSPFSYALGIPSVVLVIIALSKRKEWATGSGNKVVPVALPSESSPSPNKANKGDDNMKNIKAQPDVETGSEKQADPEVKKERKRKKKQQNNLAKETDSNLENI